MSRLSAALGPLDHVRGPVGAPVLIEYGDYQCPFCADAHSMIKSLMRSMGHELRFVFRHLPLSDLHPYALFAAEAAEAAGAQGKFWEMHDLIYENQSDFGSDLVHKLARELKLDLSRFDADMDARRFRSRVKYDSMGAMRSGVIATPTFFINDERYAENLDERSLLAALRRKITP